MPRRKIDLTPDQWMRRIEAALRDREKYARSQDWEDYERYYLCGFPTVAEGEGAFEGGNLSIVANTLYATERQLTPQVAIVDPYITMVPNEPENHAKMLVAEAEINRLLPAIGAQFQHRDACRSAYVYGTGVMKVGYDREFGVSEERLGVDVSDDAGNVLASTDEMSADRENDYGQQIEFDEEIRPGRPWIKSVPPKDFVAAPCLDITDTEWIAFRFERPVKDMQDDPLYKNTSTLKANSQSEDTVAARPGKDPKDAERPLPEEDLVVAWEVHDKRTQKVYVVAKDHDKFLRNESDGLQVGGTLPVSLVTYNKHPRSFWGISEVFLSLPQQLERNEVREQMREYRRIAGIAAFVQKNAIDPEEKEKLYSGKPLPIIETRIDPKQAVMLVNKTIPQDFYAWDQLIVQDIRDQSGLGLNQRGQTSDKSHPPTASEVMIADRYAQTPISDKRALAELAFRRCVQKCLDLMFHFWTDTRVSLVLGPDGARRWVEFRMSDLRSAYDFRIVTTSSALGNSAIRQEAFNNRLAALAQTGLLQMLLQAKPEAGFMLAREILGLDKLIDVDRILPLDVQNPGTAMPMEAFEQEAMGSMNANLRGPMPEMRGAEGVRMPHGRPPLAAMPEMQGAAAFAGGGR